jgi:histidyl-tRNA synthetase
MKKENSCRIVCRKEDLKKRTPAGTSEVYGLGARQREGVMEKIRQVYEMHGFEPLHTPILEHSVVFSGHHGEGEKLLFYLHDTNKDLLVLRYDLTVPLARFITSNPDMPRPFKRYQLATVFRDDNVDKGHYREFTQCDGDVVGASSLTADAEILSLAHHGLSVLGFDNFTLRVNHRAIIKGIALKAGIDSREGILEIQRALDFADKVIKQGLSGVERDLFNRNIPEEVVRNVMKVVGISGNLNEMISSLKEILRDDDIAIGGVCDLEEIFSYLNESVLKDVSIDLTLARGADYYTGFILEGVVNDVSVGAVLGGGRYDDLVAAFDAPHEPAVGMAFGLERILTVMKEKKITCVSKQDKVLVASMHAQCKIDAVRSALLLRNNGVYTDLCCEIEKQAAVFEYAVKRGFNVVVMHTAKGDLLIKNVESGYHLLERIGNILNTTR